MLVNKIDEKAIKLMAGMRKADLSQKQIVKLVEESGGDIVTAILKGYNAGFVRGYNKGRGQNDEVGE